MRGMMRQDHPRARAAIAAFLLATILAVPIGPGSTSTPRPHDRTSDANALGVPSTAEQFQTSGRKLFECGNFLGAITHWQSAAHLFAAAGDHRRHALALANAGAAYQSLGQTNLAESSLQTALQAAVRSEDQSTLLLIKNNLGSLYIQLQQPTRAESYLLEAYDQAQRAKDGHAMALIRNNLGNLRALQGRDADAREAYRQSSELATDDLELAARANTNLMALMVHMAQEKERVEGNNALSKADEKFLSTLATIQQLSPSYNKAQLLLSLGCTAQRLARQKAPATLADSADAAKSRDWLSRAAAVGHAALQVAEAIVDDRSASFALGYLGEIAETRGRIEDAFQFTRRARFLAQQTPSLLYRWEWQMGRLFKHQQNTPEAISAYRRAIATLQTLGDCGGPLGAEPRASFREEVAPVYYQLADLLLQQAAAVAGTQAEQRSLTEARDTIELLKSAEISDYYRDDCVSSALSAVKDIDAVLQHAAVVYYIPLPDRTEILLSLPAGLRRFKSEITANELTAVARRFRQLLASSSSGANWYMNYAKELYNQLIRPIAPVLHEKKVDTLIFVPYAALRTIPMAALHDGRQFLVEKYAIATTPGLTLMDPRPLQRNSNEVFAGGISDAVQGFNDLPGVADELRSVSQNYAVRLLLNTTFTKSSVLREIAEGRHFIVHIASHGVFGNNAKDTFLLTYDDKLSLDDLENAIRPHQFQGEPVELLILSACETAESNDRAAPSDRAALGLAGVALKSGARSALATLWEVNDKATSKLIEHFYAALKRHPALSKAQALRQAQIELLQDEDKQFHHPASWAPYLIIGNWI
jgi:CHAT domain-containing protein